MSNGALERQVRDVFERAGFYVVWTETKEYRFGRDTVQIDVISLWKNICVLAEATVQTGDVGFKLDRFSERCRMLVERNLLTEYLQFLNTQRGFHIDVEKFRRPDLNFARLFVAPNVDLETMRQRGRNLSPRVYVWDRDLLEYFKLLSKAITECSKFELLGYLEIPPETVSGEPSGIKTAEAIKLTRPGLSDDVFTFSIRAGELLEMAKVMRRDGWESDSFQRLVKEKKLDKIRNYILEGGRFFPNNIIVSLPQDVRFRSSSQTGAMGILEIPKRYGAITIIDGQHRLLGYARRVDGQYPHSVGDQAGEVARQNDQLRRLRQEHRLIVTGIKFSGGNEVQERARIFVEINNNQTPISRALIYALDWGLLGSKKPEALANGLLDRLNSDGVFRERIQVREFQTNRIPKTSIIRYALKYLVNADHGELYDVAPDDVKEAWRIGQCEPFLQHCATLIDEFFRVIVSIFSPSGQSNSAWGDLRLERYMLASVTSIVAFLRLFRHFFYWNGNRDNRFLRFPAVAGTAGSRSAVHLARSRARTVLNLISSLSFRKGESFPYRSSQWGWFEAVMLKGIRRNPQFREFGKTSLIGTKWARAVHLV